MEVPAIRNEMSGEVKMVFGLSNDLIGYIIPKSEWDHPKSKQNHPKSKQDHVKNKQGRPQK